MSIQQEPIPLPRFKAIAAMSRNRVIGAGNQIPWHLPEDFKWFKRRTMGQVLVMGRKTFESIGRPLPGRTTVVVSRSDFAHSGVTVVRSLDVVLANDFLPDAHEIFVAGGAEIYRQLLPFCSELFLSVVGREVEGDAYFPEFESHFAEPRLISEHPEFSVFVYPHRRVGSGNRLATSP